MRRTLTLLASAGVALLLASGVSLFGMEGAARAASPELNGNVAFYRDGDVWAMNPSDPGAARRLTSDSGEQANPAFSPDGTRIAYEYGHGIWVMRADGSA
ncbi:MAG TPA: hypothetical protein VGR18_10340, partial [Rubrobacter sp.]|nr:hypothetical protein [Rubrobacter sp.]